MKRITFTFLYSLLILASIVAILAAGFGAVSGLIFLATHSFATFLVLCVLIATCIIAFDVFNEVNEDGDWNP